MDLTCSIINYCAHRPAMKIGVHQSYHIILYHTASYCILMYRTVPYHIMWHCSDDSCLWQKCGHDNCLRVVRAAVYYLCLYIVIYCVLYLLLCLISSFLLLSVWKTFRYFFCVSRVLLDCSFQNFKLFHWVYFCVALLWMNPKRRICAGPH